MKAVRFAQTGGAEVLTVVDLPLPQQEPDHIPISVELAGVNYIDIYHRRGQYTLALPSGIGIEGIGRSSTGTRYFWLNNLGSYAQKINAPQSSLTEIPAIDLTNEELLPLLCQGMTAHYLVDGAYDVTRNETAVVTAAAGGVGQLLVQLLKARGVRVIALASSHERANFARSLGADVAGIYSELDQLVAELTDDTGVNVVFDSVGRDFFNNGLNSLAPTGMYVLFGGASGPVPPFDLMRLNPNSLAIRRPTLATYTASADQRIRRLNELIALRKQGLLRYPFTKVFPLGESAHAHQLIESRTFTGKIGIDPWKI
jgi:NADPH2:quinone reductase